MELTHCSFSYLSRCDIVLSSYLLNKGVLHDIGLSILLEESSRRANGSIGLKHNACMQLSISYALDLVISAHMQLHAAQ